MTASIIITFRYRAACRLAAVIAALPLLFCLAVGASAQARTRTTKSATKSSTKPPMKTAARNTTTGVVNMCPGDMGLPSAGITELLDAQNNIRTQLKLAKFTWNCQMANYAQEWANRGIFEHRSNNKYGENIYVSSNGDVTLTNVVDKWMTERDFWNNNTGVCRDGKVCSHYTQIIWRATRQIGCGINRNVTGKWKVLLVCNYDPPGDIDSPAY
jgi:pathogenesis-related protein 1